MSFSRVSEIMSDVIHLEENDSLKMAIHLFERAKISGAAVKDSEGNYTGVLSKTDIVSQRLMNLLDETGSLANIRVRDLMNPKSPITVKGDEPIDSAIELMDRYQVHRIFVIDNTEQIVGIVTTLDVVSSLRYSFEAYL